MDTKIKNYLGAVGVVVIAIIGISIIWCVSAYSNSVQPDSSFSVSGEGEVVAVPDVAEFNYRVITEGGDDMASLQQSNSEKINSANEFLKENGVDEKDIRTSSYSLSPRYQYYRCEEGPCPPPEIVGYSINQSVQVKVRDFSILGDLLSGVVERGANSVSNLNFTIDDPTELKNQAREEAIAQARDKAKSIAKAGGFKVGKLLSLDENVYSPYEKMQSMVSDEAGFGRGGESPVIEPGSQEVTVNVHLRYEIK
ncbi:MAG: SIMPL domain-containing protein [Candidatus Paceibacterota bacterium]